MRWILLLPIVTLQISLAPAVAQVKETVGATTSEGGSDSQAASCIAKLVFSADKIADGCTKDCIWGGNFRQGFGSEAVPNTGPGNEFADKVRELKKRSPPVETFAYLGGKCGKTGGVDTGEQAKCRQRRTNWDSGGWKDFTFQQLHEASLLGVDNCEVDNIPNEDLISFLEEYQRRFNTKPSKPGSIEGEITCKLVLKNLDLEQLNEIKEKMGGVQQATRGAITGGKPLSFISKFAMFETSEGSTSPAYKRAQLNDALKRLNGVSSQTIFSADTFHYGSKLDPGPGICPKDNSNHDR